jgi:YegS/Rv2252/BmrU family lipid kinase
MNPAAGHGRSARFREEVLAAARAHWGEVTLELTARPGHATELARAYAGEVERVVAVGGDGTVHEVANGLLSAGLATLPALGVVPVGTGNDFAKMTGGAGLRPAEAIAAFAAGGTRRFDVGHAWGEFFVNSLGVGLDADVARRVNLYKHWPGSLGYIVAALQAIIHRRSLQLRVDADGASWSGPTVVLEVGVGPCAGGVFFLTPDARPDDGLLDVCAIGPFGLGFLLTKAPRVLRGRHTTLPQVRMAKAAHIRIVSADGPITAHLDGELRSPGAAELDVTLRPAALPVLVTAAGLGQP